MKSVAESLSKMNFKRYSPEQLKAMKEKSDRLTIEKAKRDIKRTKANFIWQKSLFSGVEIKFTWTDWDINKATNKEIAKELGNKAYKIAQEMLKSNKRVLMYGASGTGKTSLSLAMADELKNNGQSVIFISTNKLKTLITDTWSFNDTRKQLASVKHAMLRADVLILDDLGTESAGSNGSSAGDRQLHNFIYEIADARYNQNKSVIVTTNNNSSELSTIYADGTKTLDRLLPKDKKYVLNFSKLGSVR